jgi:hypothetical protein
VASSKVYRLCFVILVEGASGAQDNDRGWQTTLDIDVPDQRHRALSSRGLGVTDEDRKIMEYAPECPLKAVARVRIPSGLFLNVPITRANALNPQMPT